MSAVVPRPPFDQLEVIPGTSVRCAWGVYGDDDQLGALNLVTQQSAYDAVGEVRTGQSFALQLPLDLPSPPFFGRQPFIHHVVRSSPLSTDDSIDGFYPQSSSQWDALGHAITDDGLAYNNVGLDDVLENGRLGIDTLGARGLVTRGVLLDIPRYHEAKGLRWSGSERLEIDADMIRSVVDWAGVDLRPGDVLCVRTGWLEHYLGLGQEARVELAEASLRLAFETPGIAPAQGIAELVWDEGIVAIALDNPGSEPFPVPFLPDGSGVDGLQLSHLHLTTALGVLLGEMWDLEALSAACAEDGRYAFLLTSAPLRIPGGLGSPPNAIAVR